ncbi:ABC transporter permease [Microbacterium protaetiae]|uniref:ABC transporter permease n=1 Tax=Microbacterium protaetiae TaxID=2509458 RepID=A0A4P6EED2_9MICO|nr:FtsX-like permease family protein [Microbacterium protaetiae]QAY60662.1 ABC transporter permease [Microbacterium protaetiae]
MSALPHHPSAERPRPSAWARWRADLRLARRQVWRTRGSSALVVLLVALPVMVLGAAAVFWQSHLPSPVQQATLELGANQSWLEVIGGPDPSRTQAAGDPYSSHVDTDENGDAVNARQPEPTSPAGLVPASATVRAVTEHATVFVDTAGGMASVPVVTGATWDAAFTGRYEILAGARPDAAGEAMASPGLLARLGAQIGDTVTLTDAERTFTITGTMHQLDQRPGVEMLFLPADARNLVSGGETRWFVADWQPDRAGLADLNHAGLIAYARDLQLTPAALQAARASGDDETWSALLFGSMAAVFCGYLVVLLAGAAFAVAARRQQRTLAVASSVGASRGDVFRVVVLQGTVLGTVAGIVGTAAAIGVATVALAMTDGGARGTFWGNWGVKLPWGMLAGILIFAVVVGTAAAIVPARAATRGDVIGALRGAGRPARLRTSRPFWGLAAMIVGLGAAIAAALGCAAVTAAQATGHYNANVDQTVRQVAVIGLVAGPVLFQVGIILAGHWVLTVASRVLARLGIAARIAGRDAAANPSRVIPAFAAIAACAFVATFAMSFLSMANRAEQSWHSWSGPLGSVSVRSQTAADTLDSDAFTAAAEGVVAPTAPQHMALVSGTMTASYDHDTGDLLDPEMAVWSVAGTTCDTCAPLRDLSTGWVSVIAPDDLETVLGMRLSTEVLDAYRAGTALDVNTSRRFAQDGTAQIVEWTAEQLADYRDAVSEYQMGSIAATDLPEPTAVHEVPARTITLDDGADWLGLAISPALAGKLGMSTVPTTLIATYSGPVSTASADAIRAAAADVRVGETGTLSVSVERGPASASPWLWLISGVTIVLVIGAGAVCLGLARFERRADDATLTAVGAGNGLRRRANAWQALIIVGLGTLAGVGAGLIPSWGITQGYNAQSLHFADTPWTALVVFVVVLPLVMTAASWLVPPRAPDLTRRTAIA